MLTKEMKQKIKRMTKEQLERQIIIANGYDDIGLKQAVIEACNGALGVYAAKIEALKQFEESKADISDMVKVRGWDDKLQILV